MTPAFAKFVVLFCALLLPASATAFEQDPSNCMAAFGLVGGNWPPITPQRATVIPSHPTTSDVVTVCVLDYVYPDRVTATRTGNQIQMTVFDSGFSWGPNPPIVISETIGRLPAGTYSLDAYVSADWVPLPAYYPYPIAADVPFVVTGAVAAVAVPALSFIWMLIAIVVLGSVGVLGMRAFRARTWRHR